MLDTVDGLGGHAMTAHKVIMKLVARGVIPEEYATAAEEELDRELMRRSRRLSQMMAALVSRNQFAFMHAELSSASIS